MKLALQLHNPFLSQVLPLEPSALQLQARKMIFNIIPLVPDRYVSNTKITAYHICLFTAMGLYFSK